MRSSSSDAVAPRCAGTISAERYALDGNKDGQPIVDTRMMLFLKLHAPLGGRVGADRYSPSEH
jgi:hypothetical protein